MGILHVTARIECDGCAERMNVDLDAAAELNDKSLYELVEDTVKGLPWLSMQGEHWLCRNCTRKVDERYKDHDDVVPLTREQVAAVLSGEEG
jgi:hypothetical protein